MIQHYHHGLVLVSLVVAILASYTALDLALRIRQASGMAARAWLLGGGFAMGIGIWAMHFVGMLALHLPIPVIDIGLPDMDGYELARRARSLGSRALLIALTGYGLSEDKNMAKQAGFDAHLTKPAAVDSLLALIAKTEPVDG